MISVLVYGRNDAYGAEMQRRAALSLNMIAAVLTMPEDEIVFVDYNSPDDGPTFPAAIADTLTPAACARLRVIRVRPAHHARRTGADAPPVLEAAARNIGLRRTDPRNAWVLSTNTDILPLVACGSLSRLAASLPAAYHGAPRMEAPRAIWETLDRADPAAAAERLAALAPALHLEEIVRHPLPALAFDAPGDFQLAPRDAFFALGGFDERMRRGWHVDANLAARMALRFGPARSCPAGLRVFHAEHTGRSAFKHAGGRSEDSFEDFVRDVADPVPPGSSDWGAPGEDFEIVSLDDDGAARFSRAAAIAAAPPAEGPGEAHYGPGSFDRAPRAEERTAVFLLDALAHHAPDAQAGWIGENPALRARVARGMAALGFRRPLSPADAASDIVIFACPRGDAPEAALSEAWAAFGALLGAEAARIEAGRPARRLLFADAVHSLFETALLTHFDCILAPFMTRLRPAIARPRAAAAEEWLERLTVGPAGHRLGDGSVALRPDVEGHALFGPHARLTPGRWRAELSFRNDPDPPARRMPAEIAIEITHGERFLARRILDQAERAAGAVSIFFEAPPEVVRPAGPGIELRLWTSGGASLLIVSARVAPAPASAA